MTDLIEIILLFLILYIILYFRKYRTFFIKKENVKSEDLKKWEKRKKLFEKETIKLNKKGLIGLRHYSDKVRKG